MFNKDLKAMPLIDTIEYREPIDSKKLNRMLNTIEESVLRALLRGSEINDFMSKIKLASVKSFLSIARKPFTQINYDKTNTLFANCYGDVYYSNTLQHSSHGAITGRIPQISQNKVLGQVTLGYTDKNTFYKTPRYDSDGDGILDKVSPSVKMYVDGTLREVDDNCYDCLNKSQDSFWIEEGTGEVVVEINYPASSDSRFNMIRLYPFPVYGFEVTNLEYQNFQSRWIEVPILTGDGAPIEMHVAPKDFNGNIRVTLNNIDTIDAYGFSAIDTAFIDYINSGTVYIPFDKMIKTGSTYPQIINLNTFMLDWYIDAPGVSNKTVIESVTLCTGKMTGTDTSRHPQSIDLDLISKANLTLEPKKVEDISGLQINSTYLKSTGNLYVGLKLKEYNRTTPIIRGARITYEIVSEGE